MRISRLSVVHLLAHGWSWLQRHRWIALALLICGIGLQIFVEVADELNEGSLPAFDLMVQSLVRPYHTPWLTQLALGISALVIWPCIVFLIAPFLLFLLFTRRFTTFWGFMLITSMTVVLIDVLKLIFDRHRPLTALVAEIGNSFPSGHATGSTVLYGLLGYIACRYWVRREWVRLLIALLTAKLILLTGLARVYLEVHYPSDVLAGWAAGAFLLFGGLLLLEYGLPARERRR